MRSRKVLIGKWSLTNCGYFLPLNQIHFYLLPFQSNLLHWKVKLYILIGPGESCRAGWQGCWVTRGAKGDILSIPMTARCCKTKCFGPTSTFCHPEYWQCDRHGIGKFLMCDWYHINLKIIFWKDLAGLSRQAINTQNKEAMTICRTITGLS